MPLVEYSVSNGSLDQRRRVLFYPNDQTQFVISTDHVHSSDSGPTIWYVYHLLNFKWKMYQRLLEVKS